MDYKKKYKEANDKVAIRFGTNVAKEIFTDLYESEDEKIRKELIAYHRSMAAAMNGNRPCVHEAWIAWLERQKVTDKEIIFRPVVGTDIRIAAKQALEKIDIGKKVVLAFNGAYIPVNGKTVGEIDSEYDAWLEKQGDSPIKWNKNTKDCKPQVNHSVLMKTTHGIAEGDWQGELWHQYRWAGIVRDTDVLSWMELSSLEKQNEQEPVNDTDEDIVESVKDTSILDLVEPRFHEGDWVVWQDKCYKVNYNGCGYELVDQNGLSTSLEYGTIDENAHLWDITKDAKDGDVLACGDKVTDCPFIFHNLTEELNPRSYCGVNMLRHFQDNDENGGFWCYSDEVRPATKEQRDILFSKMKEAGYVWDAEKKELKKIDVRENLTLDGDLMEADCKIVEQKPAWSEEDEKILNTTISFLSEYAAKGYENAVMCMDWLKSLKERIE